MNARVFTAAIAVLGCLLLVCGCTQTAPPTPTPVPVTTEIPPPTTIATVATTAAPQTTEQVQSLPAIWNIDVQVTSNGEAINPLIVVTNRGGKGLNFINELDARVTRSDGIVEEDKMVKPMFVGKTLELKGTTKPSDRVEVWAITPEGQRVKIIDTLVCFRCY